MPSPTVPLRFDAPTLADALGLPRHRPTPPPALPDGLTALLPLLADNLTARQIARHLTLSEPAVKHRLRRLYTLLGVHNRVGAVCAAMVYGLLEAPATKES
jgi:DNA-binding NarL/FixJ family response regulator